MNHFRADFCDGLDSFLAFIEFAECHGIVTLFESNVSAVFDGKRKNEIEILQVEMNCSWQFAIKYKIRQWLLTCRVIMIL